MFENQGLLAIAFFEVTALIVLLVLFFLLRRDHSSGYFRLWLGGWAFLTISSQFELGLIAETNPMLRMGELATRVTALLLFLYSMVRLTAGIRRRRWPFWPVLTAALTGPII